LVRQNIRTPACDDVTRHQVRRELDALEGQVQGFSEAADEQRFRKTGDTDEQAVAARE
jgi:hypothetical protein